jgi:hypothetical protein
MKMVLYLFLEFLIIGKKRILIIIGDDSLRIRLNNNDHVLMDIMYQLLMNGKEFTTLDYGEKMYYNSLVI